ncbi:twin-arginine translocase subunit TatC [Methanonatronarchaeum sp. AMET6-2]|uniref:twin-arginine translocase subunit TatC n=1 Tax=Methanonatronarchaeum sp. AMET6-2 TaxID=2933293 RepID=UPI001211D374|nr:twin-arginine translocase subunit TatC [Methanonatronarchaeum sp. AMET6-2]RZN60982.1 MAG: preprotein translocase subunit TatC [Methanonatronarchaeia archaeon]UOY10675.1 twin-arginine translocase subunit TatC [Methanonatronarchaeum sp. AMET6-2]
MSEGYQRYLEEIDEVLKGVRANIIKIFIVAAIASAVGYLLTYPAMSIIENQMLSMVENNVEVIYIGPLELVIVQFKLGFAFGLIVTLPLIFYYIYQAIDERIDRINVGLNFTKREVITLGILSVVLFLIGAAYAWFLMAPLTFEALVMMTEMVDPDMRITYTISKFIQLVALLVLGFGLTFEMPIVLNLLIRSGLMSYESIKSKRKIIYVFILVLSAFITGPTIITQFMVAIPLFLFFEISLIVAKKAEDRRTARLARTVD